MHFFTPIDVLEQVVVTGTVPATTGLAYWCIPQPVEPHPLWALGALDPNAMTCIIGRIMLTAPKMVHLGPLPFRAPFILPIITMALPAHGIDLQLRGPVWSLGPS